MQKERADLERVNSQQLAELQARIKAMEELATVRVQANETAEFKQVTKILVITGY